MKMSGPSQQKYQNVDYVTYGSSKGFYVLPPITQPLEV